MTNEHCTHDLGKARQKVVHDVNSFGWHVMVVLPTAEMNGWAYSIGLFKNYRHPEAVIFGLDLDVMHKVINIVGQIVKGGRRFTDHTETDELLEGYACSLRAIHEAWMAQFLGFATWFYNGAAFPTLQVFWPDRNRRYPWHADFDRALRPRQQQLFHADPAAAATEAFTLPSDTSGV